LPRLSTTLSAVEINDLGATKGKSRGPLRTLNAGNYTAIVRGKNNSVGNALIEVY